MQERNEEKEVPRLLPAKKVRPITHGVGKNGCQEEEKKNLLLGCFTNRRLTNQFKEVGVTDSGLNPHLLIN